ncbi:MAG: phosphoribosyltransferase family protein [Bacteroidota bacterium]
MLKDLLNLFFPNYCLACQQTPLVQGEELICTPCAYELPQTDCYATLDNLIAQKLYGHLPVSYACSLYKLRKGSGVERLLYALKYGNKPQVGSFLGKKHGTVLAQMPWCQKFDLIVPIPLHSTRIRQRGYNQSSLFAQGLSEVLGVPWEDTYLRRIKKTTTQTKKSRFERLQNVADAFCITVPQAISDRHILLVDDVITTGATLSSCGKVLMTANAKSLSVATIAVAES